MTGRGRRLRRTLLWALALLLLTLAACGQEEPRAAMEGVLVYQHGETFYLYAEGGGDLIYTVPDQASGAELAVGQKVRVNFDGSVREIAPPQFDKIYSVDILGQAEEEEFQEGLDYFNTEVKPWHLPEDGPSPEPAEAPSSIHSPENPAVIEGVLVYESDGFYFYTEDYVNQLMAEGDDVNLDLVSRIFTLSPQEKVSNGQLEVGQKIRINHDGMNNLMAPPSFCDIYSIDILGQAEEEEFQKGLDYFNAEVKPWHLPEEGGQTG